MALFGNFWLFLAEKNVLMDTQRTKHFLIGTVVYEETVPQTHRQTELSKRSMVKILADFVLFEVFDVSCLLNYPHKPPISRSKSKILLKELYATAALDEEPRYFINKQFVLNLRR